MSCEQNGALQTKQFKQKTSLKNEEQAQKMIGNMAFEALRTRERDRE